MLKDIILYLHIVVQVLFECMGQLGVETPFLKVWNYMPARCST